MDRRIILGFGIFAGIAAWLYSQQSKASEAPQESGPTSADLFGGNMDSDANVAAFLSLIRHAEANDQYNIIAGNDYFDDFSEHPFVLNPNRPKPLGTTASGGYQMVVGTWKMARDALELNDFSPASQDAAAVWLLQYKRPGALDAVRAGHFTDALQRVRGEWEAFDKMLKGTYPITLADAQSIYTTAGGTVAV